MIPVVGLVAPSFRHSCAGRNPGERSGSLALKMFDGARTCSRRDAVSVACQRWLGDRLDSCLRRNDGSLRGGLCRLSHCSPPAREELPQAEGGLPSPFRRRLRICWSEAGTPAVSARQLPPRCWGSEGIGPLQRSPCAGMTHRQPGAVSPPPRALSTFTDSVILACTGTTEAEITETVGRSRAAWAILLNTLQTWRACATEKDPTHGTSERSDR